MMQPPSPDAKNQPSTNFAQLSQHQPSELLHYKTEIEAVQRISQALFQSLDLDELVETTLHIALEEVDAEAGSILLADSEKEELIFQYSIGESLFPEEHPFPGIRAFQDQSSSRENLGSRAGLTTMPPIFSRSTKPPVLSPGT